MFWSEARCAGTRRSTLMVMVPLPYEKSAVAEYVPSLTVPATRTLICTLFVAPEAMVMGKEVTFVRLMPLSDTRSDGAYTVMLAFPVFFSVSVTVFSFAFASPYRASSEMSHVAPVTESLSACAVCTSTTNTRNSNAAFFIITRSPRFQAMYPQPRVST